MNNYLKIFEPAFAGFKKKLANASTIVQGACIEMVENVFRLFKANFLIILSLCLIIIIPFLFQSLIININLPKTSKNELLPSYLVKVADKIEKERNTLQRKLNNKTPRGYFLTINSALNEFTLYKGNQKIKTDKCSTGSYVLLKNSDKQQWMFKTPKGQFSILGKTTSPVWKKPDWAFVEEGLSVPSENHYSRFEYGVLGDYALSLGHGYLLHGTLYQRFLGLPVTHGCIRLNDENLELIYNSLSMGSKVYIY